MSSPQYSVLFSAPVSGTGPSSGSVADVLIPDSATSLYVKATTANRGTRRSTGIALSAYAAGGVVDIQQFGQVDTATAGLGAGTASWVRCSTTGVLERATVSGSDDVVGWVDTDGTFHACFGFLTAAIVNGGGSGFTPPTGTGLVTVTSGNLDGASTPLAANMATFLGTATSANLAAAVSDETGTGFLVFHTSPRFVTPTMWNPAVTFRYLFAGSAIVADRTVTWPLLTGNDTVVTAAFAQALTNKTIDGANNTLTVRIASDVTGLGTGVSTFLVGPLATGFTTFSQTPSGANLASLLTSALPVSKGGTNLTALISAMGALAIDWSVASSFTKTLGAGSNTITFSNQVAGQTIVVRFTGAASTVTWPSPSVKWAGGVAPTQTASGTDVYTFFYDGTNTYGSVVQALS